MNIAFKAANTIAAICFLSAMPSMADNLSNDNSESVNTALKPTSNKHIYSISYLKNINDFQLINNDDIDVVTLEYGGKYTWGDSFVFFDRLVAAADDFEPKKQKNYFEASVRLSIPFLLHQSTSRLVSSRSVQGSYVKDFFVAGTVEYSYLNIESSTDFSSTSTNSLIGLGIAWQSTFFSYLNTNIYYAINEKKANDYQLTLSFAKSFTISELLFKTNGFIDWSSAASDHKSSFHLSPQVLLDLGDIFNQPKLVFVGIEYSFWRNKFGLANIADEHTVSVMVKLNF